MRTIQIYVDTSVFGGAEDEEFAEASQRVFRRVISGDFFMVLSTETLRELQTAPPRVRDVLDGIPDHRMRVVPVSPEIKRLSQAYLQAGILGKASQSDAIHVAAATVAEVDVILSWNFRHIVNYDRIHKYNAINVLHGYRPLEIHSPPEMINDDPNENI